MVQTFHASLSPRGAESDSNIDLEGTKLPTGLQLQLTFVETRIKSLSSRLPVIIIQFQGYFIARMFRLIEYKVITSAKSKVQGVLLKQRGNIYDVA